MEVELRLWRSFVTVAEELHYGRAAERLYITQPALSRQIHELERALGLSLFERTSRRVTLTAAGSTVLAQARRVLAESERALGLARLAAAGNWGSIAIGVLPAVSLGVLPAVIRAHRTEHPNVAYTITECFDDEQFELLKAGRIDIGLLRAAAGPPGIRLETLLRERVVAVLPSAHRFARYDRLALAELADEDFVFFPRQRSALAYDQFIASCRAAGFTPNIVQEASGVATLGLIAAGLGVSVLAEAYTALAPTGVRYVPIVGHELTLQLAWIGGTSGNVVDNFLNTARRVAAESQTDLESISLH